MRRSSLWTKTVAFGILVAASVLGNVSFSASRAKPIDAVPASASRASTDLPRLLRGDAAMGIHTSAAGRASEAAVDDDRDVAGSEASSEGEVVPAIYAWDPDVRFVFYRHVSKWM